MKKIYVRDRRSFFSSADADFQWRYSLILALSVGLTVCLFLSPFVYVLNENFEIFRKLAIENQPNLLEHLDREVQWITFAAGAGVFISVLFSIAFGYKLTGSIVGPLVSLERHMKKVINGDISQVDFKVRANDEFKRLAQTYSYLYKTIREKTLKDVEDLYKVRDLTKHAEAFKTICEVIERKEKELKFVINNEIDNGLKSNTLYEIQSQSEHDKALESNIEQNEHFNENVASISSSPKRRRVS